MKAIWDKQYEGYLMSSYVTDTKLTFECVDMEPDIISGETTLKLSFKKCFK